MAFPDRDFDDIRAHCNDPEGGASLEIPIELEAEFNLVRRKYAEACAIFDPSKTEIPGVDYFIHYLYHDAENTKVELLTSDLHSELQEKSSMQSVHELTTRGALLEAFYTGLVLGASLRDRSATEMYIRALQLGGFNIEDMGE